MCILALGCFALGVCESIEILNVSSEVESNSNKK